MIISCVSVKGGSGKTTVCLNLASYFVLEGYNVIIVDADINGNITRFLDSRPDEAPEIPHAVLNSEGDFKNNFDNITKGYDIVLIDGRPAIDTLASYLLMISNVSIIPIKPSPLDMWTNDDVFMQIYHKAKDRNSDLKSFFLMNCVKPGTNLAYECKALLYDYKANTNITTLESEVADRVIYAESIIQGLGVLEMSGAKYATARGEVRKLGDEIIKQING